MCVYTGKAAETGPHHPKAVWVCTSFRRIIYYDTHYRFGILKKNTQQTYYIKFNTK